MLTHATKLGECNALWASISQCICVIVRNTSRFSMYAEDTLGRHYLVIDFLICVKVYINHRVTRSAFKFV